MKDSSKHSFVKFGISVICSKIRELILCRFCRLSLGPLTNSFKCSFCCFGCWLPSYGNMCPFAFFGVSYLIHTCFLAYKQWWFHQRTKKKWEQEETTSQITHSKDILHLVSCLLKMVINPRENKRNGNKEKKQLCCQITHSKGILDLGWVRHQPKCNPIKL